MIAVAALAVAGCGSSSSSTSAASTSKQASAEFGGPGGNSEAKTLASFGHEASAEEREEASQVLEENLGARAKHDWAGQCASLSAKEVKTIEKRAEFIVSKPNQSCAKGLELEAEFADPTALENSLTGPIDVLRVEGAKAYALYHGTHGQDYGMPMVKEGGKWKVASLTTISLSKS